MQVKNGVDVVDATQELVDKVNSEKISK